MPGDVGYNQAKMMATNTDSAMNMKSPKKMKKGAMKLKKKSFRTNRNLILT